MREIKFRAWHKAQGVMTPVHGIDFVLGMVIVDVGTIHITQLDDSLDEYELMQYTGLKDKTGREIYDGDIFKGLHDFGPGGFQEQTASVEFEVDRGYRWNYWLHGTLEVIGNIYENSELLEIKP